MHSSVCCLFAFLMFGFVDLLVYFVRLHVYWFVCLSACSIGCVFDSVFDCLFVYLSASLFACLVVCVLAKLFGVSCFWLRGCVLVCLYVLSGCLVV